MEQRDYLLSENCVRLVSYTSHSDIRYIRSVKFMLPDKVQANLMNYSNFGNTPGHINQD